MGPTLRASCDNCNLAKVKCTKQNPQCQRCQKHNTDCIYGISLRAGKRASQAAPQRKIKTTPAPVTDWSIDFSGTSNVYSPLEMEPSPLLFDYDTPFPLDEYQSTGYFSSEDALSLPDLSFPDTMQIQSNLTTTNISSTTNPSPVMSDTMLSFLNSNHNTPISPFAFCSCFGATIFTLSTLQQLSESSHTSFDVALAHNKEAVALCLSTLKCSCAQDSTILLLMASLLAKIISIYEQLCGAWRAVDHSRISMDMKAIMASLTLGANNLDEMDEKLLKTEILKLELRKVEDAVFHLGDHFNMGTTGVERRVHVEGFLSDKLRGVFLQRNGIRSEAVC